MEQSAVTLNKRKNVTRGSTECERKQKANYLEAQTVNYSLQIEGDDDNHIIM